MARISFTFRDRWRSGRHIGASRPTQVVRIRRGEFRRKYDKWEEADVHASMPGKSASTPWQAFWHVLDDWRDLPNVVEVNIDQDFDKNGTASCTVLIDNVAYGADDQGFGVFHRILRGFLAPFRGYAVPWSPNPRPMPTNEWFRYLNSACQIEVWQGYGDDRVCTYTGLTEHIDLTSAPDQVTIAARDFGVQLTDQHNLGWAKDRALARKATIFADRRSHEKVTHEGTAGPRDCSSARPGHPARYVADEKNAETAWISANKDKPDNTEWVQVRLPQGRYESFYLDAAYAGMECWVSIYGKGTKHSWGTVKVDGQVVEGGWLDFNDGAIVPGVTGEADGGHHFVKHYSSVDSGGHWHQFGHSIEVGDNSILRVSFRKLRKVHEDGHVHYRAAVRRLIGAKRKTFAEATKNRWILVDDLSDIVKVVLRWAGFKEWEIESTGARLPPDTKLTFHNGDTLMDIIKKVQEITNYTFFMGDPSGGDFRYSIGVPVFRTPNVLGYFDLGREQVRDTDLLTGIQVKWDSATLPEVIYIRGKEAKKAKGGKGGLFLGEDKKRRIQVQYHPPWRNRSATGGVIRHFVQTYNSLKTRKELEVAARYVALNGALQSTTAIIEIPGHPGITVDSIVGVQDEGTGTNTRLYVASRSSVFRSGEETSWKMTLGGSLIDVPDVQEVAAELFLLVAPHERKEAISQVGPATYGNDGPIAVGGHRQARRPRRRRTRTRR